MAFRNFKEFPKNFRFIADGYSAYPLAAMEFARKFKDSFNFKIHRSSVLPMTTKYQKNFALTNR